VVDKRVILTHWRNDIDNAMNELWRAQQNAATRVAEGWLGLLQPGADGAPELQRDLADSMTAWARQQREYADAMDRLLAPFSPHA
jgi:hypothetical protein